MIFSVLFKISNLFKVDAFELWCWRRLLRVPWTAMRSNQSILKEISPEYSLEGLMLKLKLLRSLRHTSPLFENHNICMHTSNNIWSFSWQNFSRNESLRNSLFIHIYIYFSFKQNLTEYVQCARYCTRVCEDYKSEPCAWTKNFELKAA